MAPLLFASAGIAQTEQADAITQINGETLTADVTKVYFNAANCADPANTLFDLTLTNGDGVGQAFLWAGTENAGCEQETNRTDQTLRCRPVNGNPRTVGDNATIFDLTLQELIDTEVVDCENTSLEGAPFSIYAFRNQDPGGENVAVEGYGVAPFRVDVTPPNQLTLTSGPVQEGSSFSVAWNSPTDSQSIPQYRLYAAATDDPDAALANPIVKTAGIDKKSISVNTGELNLAPGEEIYLFASAVDEAAVAIGNGNEGPLSDSTLGIAAETFGFCDDPNVDCSGCSVSPLVLPSGQPSAGLWVMGLVFAIVAGWRLRR
ncbi:MAG: hypothetical protein HKN97_05655 [Myxococcales bacterium]|nr:hypothetical protein [Myxococcales bacterium]NNK07535.1 hypothetical protein [Myxococcales bacterium]NNK41497.1 hypothetical protein [Myxococcales bacterium]